MSVVNDLIEEVRRLAAESPDKVAACQYIDFEDQPVCIVGHAVRNIGFTEFEENWFQTNSDVMTVLRTLDERGNYEERCWLGTVQAHQDDGAAWSEAVALADKACG